MQVKYLKMVKPVGNGGKWGIFFFPLPKLRQKSKQTHACSVFC